MVDGVVVCSVVIVVWHAGRLSFSDSDNQALNPITRKTHIWPPERHIKSLQKNPDGVRKKCVSSLLECAYVSPAVWIFREMARWQTQFSPFRVCLYEPGCFTVVQL